MTLARVQEEAEKADRLFPLSLASEGSCTIGGNLATNAGGTAVLAYGNARELVQGLEVVLADGRVLSNLSKLKKDNTGYDLKHLFMGSEGTLGIITAAVVKLYPRPRSTETAFVGLKNPQAALDLLMFAQKLAGQDVKTFELMPRIGLDFALKHGTNTRDPLDSHHAWYVMLELASPAQAGLHETMLHLLQDGMDAGLIENATLAASLDQRQDFWRLRELMSDVQKMEGGSIKHDVSVPVARVPELIEQGSHAIAAWMPGARPVKGRPAACKPLHCSHRAGLASITPHVAQPTLHACDGVSPRDSHTCARSSAARLRMASMPARWISHSHASWFTSSPIMMMPS
jgi:FAD/FMN-containing dehydrogenase